MKDENLKSNPEESSVNYVEIPEAKAVPVDDSLQPNVVPHEEIHEDDVIVYLDDHEDLGEPEAAPELLSHRPGEEDVLSEFERLPEVRAELVEEIPEVFNVEDITSLVTEEVEGDWTDLFADREIVLERCKEFVSLHRKWFAGAAAVILFAVVAVSFSGGGEAVSSASSSEVNATAEAFDQWVDRSVANHLLEIGEAK